MKKLFVTVALLIYVSITSHAQVWEGFNGGLGCETGDMVYDFTITGLGKIVARGAISRIHNGCQEAYHVATYDGANWQPLFCNNGGIGIGQGIAEYRGKLHTLGNDPVCESIPESRTFVIRWDEDTYDHLLVNTKGGSSRSLIVHNDKLYVCGSFDKILGEDFCALFSMQGDTITPLVHRSEFFGGTTPEGFPQASGIDLAFYRDTLYMGGKVQYHDQNARIDNLAFVQDSILHKVGIGLDFGKCIVEALCVHRDTLFIGGLFAPDPVLGNTNWEILMYYANGHLGSCGLKSDRRIYDLESYNDELYFAGQFQTINDEQCLYVGKMNGRQIVPLNYQAINYYEELELINQSGNVRDLLIHEDHLYISGRFGHIGPNSEFYGSVAKLATPLSQIGIGRFEQPIEFFTLHPNPATQSLTLTAGQAMPAGTLVQMHDMAGRVVHRERLPVRTTTHTVDVAALAPGVYTCTLQHQSQRYQTIRWVRE